MEKMPQPNKPGAWFFFADNQEGRWLRAQVFGLSGSLKCLTFNKDGMLLHDCRCCELRGTWLPDTNIPPEPPPKAVELPESFLTGWCCRREENKKPNRFIYDASRRSTPYQVRHADGTANDLSTYDFENYYDTVNEAEAKRRENEDITTTQVARWKTLHGQAPPRA